MAVTAFLLKHTVTTLERQGIQYAYPELVTGRRIQVILQVAWWGGKKHRDSDTVKVLKHLGQHEVTAILFKAYTNDHWIDMRQKHYNRANRNSHGERVKEDALEEEDY